MASELERLLLQNSEALDAELARARARLAELRAEEGALEGLIERAEYALGRRSVGGSTQDAQSARRGTLKAAMIDVLREAGVEGLTAKAIADAVNARGAYLKRDGSQIGPGQVHAYATNYESVFTRSDGRIRLLDESA
jgi:hypothetical protein